MSTYARTLDRWSRDNMARRPLASRPRFVSVEYGRVRAGIADGSRSRFGVKYRRLLRLRRLCRRGS